MQQPGDIGRFVEVPRQSLLAYRFGDREQERLEETQLLRPPAHPACSHIDRSGRGRAAEVDRPKGPVLTEFDAAAARQLEDGGESRGERRAAKHLAAQLPWQEARQLAPIRYMADKTRQPAQCIIHRIEFGRLDRQHRRFGPTPSVAIGAQQFIESQLIDRHRDHGEAFRRATKEHILPDARAPHQPDPGSLHRFQQSETMLQLGRELGPARFVVLRRLRQQQPRFQIGEPSRHHQVVGGDLEVERMLFREESKILVGQRQYRNLAEIDLLLARQRQQKVDRPLVTVEL